MVVKDAGYDRTPLLLSLSVRLLPADVRDEVLGDLVEHWNADVSARRWTRRVLWLSRQPLEAMTSRLRYPSGARHGAGLRPARRRGFGFYWLDVKLGIRMMRKHPGVSLVIVFALALGIPASLAPHHAIDALMDESPPFEEGDRVVGLVAYGGESGRRFFRLGDYELIREELTTFGAIGAALPREVNVISGDGRSAGEMEQALAAWPWVLLITSGAVIAVGLVACLQPTLRGLRTHPVEALRADG